MADKGNGKVVSTVIEELQERGEAGLDRAAEALEAAQAKLKDADLAEKVDRLLDFVEENATVIATVMKRLAGEAAKETKAAAATVGEAAVSTVGAAGDAIESIGEEVIQPTVRYGKGLRHGILIGAVLALFLTPWPGRELRTKVSGLVKEAADIIDAMRAGAADTGASA